METVWHGEQVSKLIKLYKQKDILWDPSNKHHKNTLLKKEAWEDISRILKIPRHHVEAKVHILRSQFSREKKRLTKNAESDSDNVKSRWFRFDSLKFLNDLTSARSLDTTPKIQDSDQTQPQLIQDEDSSNQSSVLTTESPPPPLPVSCSKKRKYDEDPLETYEIMKSKEINRKTESKDEFEIYGQYIASELRNVKNERALIHAKYYINKIILNARLGKYDSSNRSEPVSTLLSTAEPAPTFDDSVSSFDTKKELVSFRVDFEESDQ